MFSLVGDGSYLMLNSEIYSSVLSGQKMILVVCDNGGFAVIERLQVGQGGASYNNMLADSRGPGRGRTGRLPGACRVARVPSPFESSSLAELDAALATARAADRTTVIVTEVRASDWTEGGAFWEVGRARGHRRARVVAAAGRAWTRG